MHLENEPHITRASSRARRRWIMPLLAAASALTIGALAQAAVAHPVIAVADDGGRTADGGRTGDGGRTRDGGRTGDGGREQVPIPGPSPVPSPSPAPLPSPSPSPSPPPMPSPSDGGY